MNFKQNLLRGGVVVSLVVLLSAGFAPAAKAAEPVAAPDAAFNVVVSPPSIALTTKPGVPVTTDIKVRNQGLATEHVKVTVMKFGAKGQDGTPTISDLDANDDFGKWVTFSSSKFDAEPNVWQTVKLTISPPKNAAFGYYYAIVFSRDGADKVRTTKANNLLGAVASLVLLDVQSPGAVRQAKIAEFSTPHKVVEFLPVDFTVRMYNSGNTHVAARGNIDIFKGNKNLGIMEVNFNKGYILPRTYRVFTNEWKDGSPLYKVQTADGKVVLDKDNRPVQKLSWDNFNLGKLRFGQYTAKLVMVYNDGQGDVSTEAKVNFWVIPWRILAVLLVLLVMFLTTLWFLIFRPLRRRFTRGKVHGPRRF